MILDIINTYGAEILGAILLAMGGAFGRAMYKLASHFINEKIIAKVAKTVVRFVEQVFTDLHGDDKLNKALEHFALVLSEYGIKLSAARMKVYLEAAVREMNQAFFSVQPLQIAEGIDVDDMTDDQLRAVLQQIGHPVPMSFTREDMLAALDEAAEQANT